MNLTKRLLLSMFLCLSFSAMTFAQTVSGTVTSAEGEPLIGATVQVQGTTDGVATDIDGMYSISANTGDVLEISYVGFRSKSVTVSGPTMNITMDEDATTLDELVVSATRRPVRKLQATTAINSISTQELGQLQAESFTEAIQNTPGITVDDSQGRKGDFNIRGFPGGNFTTTLINGLPVSGIANLAGGNQEFYGLDATIERIEVVRGAAATLFGRSAAAGAVNIISKVGGLETKGTVSLTKYNNVSNDDHQFEGDFDFRADWNINGAINDDLRYNIGGYFINDSGNKEQYAKDKGTQLRGNLDWLISNTSKIQFSASYYNNEFQNITDAVWDLEKGELPDGWDGSSTYYNDPDQMDRDLGVRQSFFNPTPAINQATGQPLGLNIGRNAVESAIGGSIGFDALFDLGQGWAFNSKFQYSNSDWKDVNEVGLTDFYTATSNISRLNATAYNIIENVITENRISKLIEGDNATHNLTAGLYYSTGQRDRLGLNYFYTSNVSPRADFGIAFGLGNGSFSNPTLPQTAYISNTSSHREEKSTAFFIGDEMVFNNKLSVNVGLRYDWLNTIFNNDPHTVRDNIDFDPGTFAENDLDFNDVSWSIGANYLIGESSAVYGNIVRAFTLPSINISSMVPEDNEVAKNIELGYRAGLGDLVVDLTLFNTNIDNAVTTVFDASQAVFVQVPAGSYKIQGGELSLTYTPKSIKGLLLRTALTLQDSKYDSFSIEVDDSDPDGNIFGNTVEGSGMNRSYNVAGNFVPGRANTLINFSASYNADNWGADIGGNSYSGAKADPLNVIDEPNFSVVNMGAYFKFAAGNGNDNIKIGIRVKNLFNREVARNLIAGSAGDGSLAELQAHPTGAGRLGWAVIQNPRRVLLTAAYNF